MATRSCPNCGTQYVASVRRCIDCDLMLVDDVDADETEVTSGAEPVGAGEQVAYELDGWGNQLKVTLEGMLDRAEIARVWEAGALVVDARFEDDVDALIAVVEGADIPELDADLPQIAFEIDGLDADRLAVLDARLIAESLPHAWSDEGELLVAEADEDRATDLIQAVLDDELEADADGPSANEVLSDLYVATDRLMKKPTDAKVVAAVADAATRLDGVGVPYGLSGEDWTAILAQVGALVEVLGVEPADALDDDPEVEADVDPADEAEDGSEADGSPGQDAAQTVAERASALRNRLLDFV